MKNTALFLTIGLLFFYCTKNKNFNVSEKDIYIINIDNCLRTVSQTNMSEIADSLEYLILKTPPKTIITQIRRIIYAKPYLFMTSKGIAYQFKTDGTFVRQIGGKGKGPGEYLGVENILVDTVKKEIILCTIFNFLYYNFEGDFLRSVKLIAQSASLLDSTIWISNPSRGREKLKLFGLNYNMDTIGSLINYDIWKSKTSGYYSVTSKYLNPFYHYNSKLYFKGFQDSDTIWEIKESFIRLHAIINLGKYKLPTNYQADFSPENFNKYASNYYSIPYVAEDSRFLFFLVQPWKGLKLPVSYILYNKADRKGSIIKKDTIMGINDDILYGPPFWPLTITDEFYLGAIEAEEILNYHKKRVGQNNKIKSLLLKIDENSNQLIIIAKKKLFNKI